MVTLRQCRFSKDKEGRPLNLENVIIENNVNTQKVVALFCNLPLRVIPFYCEGVCQPY